MRTCSPGDVLLAQLEALVVRDGAGVAEVVDAAQLALAQGEAGNKSWAVMEFGMFTTFSYLEIFVMKLRGDRSSEMGILLPRR